MYFWSTVFMLGIVTLAAVNAQDVSDEQGEGDSIKGEKKEPAAPAKPIEPSSGPTLYYDGKEFMLEVKPGFILKAYQGNSTKPIGSVKIDKAAVPITGGSTANSNGYSVSIDWKELEFSNGDFSVSNVYLRMSFEKTKKKEWKLTAITIDKARVNGKPIMDNAIAPVSSSGVEVTAPLGLSYCCGSPGVFMPTGRDTIASDQVRLGLEMPDMQMQVYDVKRFGPSWYCGGTSIGLWVTLLVTLFFASVCYCGFGMLANINTMDRFDDPKGKPIHVPNTD